MTLEPINQKTIQQLINTAIQYHKTCKFKDAESLYNQILTIDPENFDALHLSGVLAHQAGDNDKAVCLIEQALQQDTSNPFALNNLGEVYRALNRLEEAEKCYLQSIENKPDYYEAYNNLGNALNQRGLQEKAIQAYRQAINIKPEFADAHNNLGNILTAREQFNEAQQAFQQVLRLKPDSAEAYNNYGNLLLAIDQQDKAEQAYRKALELKPDFAVPYNNLGMIFLDRGQLEDGIEACRKAISLQPEYDIPYFNIGTTYQETGKLAEAELSFKNALSINPDNAPCKWNLSLLLLLQGRYEEGFNLYESRFMGGSGNIFTKMNGFLNQLQDSVRWQGETLQDKSLLLIAEQGLGDGLMMFRYGPLLKLKGLKRLIIYCEPALLRLFQCQTDVDDVVSMSDPLPFGKFDLFCPSMSLPYLFKTQLESIPNSIPYIALPDDLKRHWLQRFESLSATKVGLVWAGKDSYKKNQLRSISLEHFTPLVKIHGIQFISLQKGYEARSPKELGWNFIDWIDECGDLLDTAALIDQLDLVISVDTSVAHLAGALGKPVWLLNRFESEWRWLLERDDSPWYPSMRIFRQKAHGDWDSVIAEVSRALQERVLLQDRTTTVSVNSIEDLFQQALLAIDNSDPNTAIPILRNLLQRMPHNSAVWFNLGRSYDCAGKVSDAEHAYRQALLEKPDSPAILFSLGDLLLKQRSIHEAELCLLNAHNLKPDSIKILLRLASALFQQNKPSETFDVFHKILKLQPDNTEVIYYLAILQLRTGDYRSGFINYEARLSIAHFDIDSRNYSQPRWDGSPLNGRSILIFGEQGMGDVIQLSRYIQLVVERGGKVVFEIDKLLIPLFESFPGIDRIVSRSKTPPVTDVYIQSLSLPYIFCTAIDTVPHQVPYITSDPEKTEQWRQRLASNGPGLRIGIVWRGNPLNPFDKARSTSLVEFLPLAKIHGVHLFSLQLGAGIDELARVADNMTLIDHTAQIRDFSDTAAFIANLDLIIGVDTAVTHLAGAMGKKVWLILPHVYDWRWLVGRNDSPWYPTMCVFWQNIPGDWADLLSRVKCALEECLKDECTGDDSSNTAIFYNQQGIALLNSGLCADAERSFTKAIEIDSCLAEAHANLGVALSEQNRFEESLACYRTAIALKPDYMQAYFNMANSCRSLGNLVGAATCYEQALNLTPDFVPPLLCLGEILKEQGNYIQAQQRFEAVTYAEPQNMAAYQGLGESLHGQEDYPGAIRSYLQALSLSPQNARVCNLMGLACHHAGMFAEAEAYFRKACELAPDDHALLNNLGTVLHSQERSDEEIAVYRQLLGRDATCGDGHWNLSLALLGKGLFTEGFQEYEWRFTKMFPVPIRHFSEQRWDGSALEGKTILLHCEQGFGDTIQFVRYVPLVIQRGGKVIIECQSHVLKRLLTSLSEVEVFVTGERLPSFACHLPLLSLPFVFNTTLDSIPTNVPYLFPTHENIEYWRLRLGPSKAFRIGIAWFGRQNLVLNRKRSCPLEEFAPLVEIPNTEFYSLQVGEGAEQLAACSFSKEVIDYSDHFKDFADTAAFIMNLDLVITIDSAVAHLAGALGVPTWTLLSFGADWRWLLHRQDSPWYPTMQLFRQPSFGDWHSVTCQVRASLTNTRHGLQRTANTRITGITSNMCAVKKNILRVGVVWSGSVGNSLNHKRSCPFSALSPLFELPNIMLVNLQLGTHEKLDERLVDFSEEIQNFEDTAAVMANLDLIISVDTSVAHLAAATGRPTWVLLSRVPDWRWFAVNEKSLWYPNVLLFQQADFGDWDSVVREVVSQLAQFPDNQLNGKITEQPADARGGSSAEVIVLERLLADKQKALIDNDSCADTHLDIGAALGLLGRHDEAAKSFQRAITLQTNNIAGHLNLAYSLLAMGKYSEAWQHLEWRLQRIQQEQIPPWPMLQHNELGSHQSGTSLLVHCEQGYGDTIMFCRFLPLLAEAGYRVVVNCQPALASLLASLRGVGQVVPHGELLPTCDLQVLMLSLPCIFAVTLESIPLAIPYLRPKEISRDMWMHKIEQKMKLM